MRVRGIDIAVEASGAGRPLLWGHGLLGSMLQEDAAALLDWKALAGSARLLRYDARGHGRSEATLDARDYRWPELARDLLALSEATSSRRPVLGGLSMGCATALHAAAASPRHAAGLVLVAPPTGWDTRPRQSRLYRMLATAIGRVGLGPLRCAGRLGGLAGGQTHLARLRRSVTASLGRADARAVVAALRGAADSDLPAPSILNSVRAPALVLAWRGDPAHPLSTAETLSEALPRAELRVARNLDDVRSWSEAIREFLKRLAPPGSPALAPPPD
jgi:pimeloyl-ACP methyl ester carboxylesterase